MEIEQQIAEIRQGKALAESERDEERRRRMSAEASLAAMRAACAQSGGLLAVNAWRTTLDASGAPRVVASPAPAYVKRDLITGVFDATMALQGLDHVTYDFGTPVGLMLEGGAVLYCDCEDVDAALALVSPAKEKGTK